MQKLLKFWQPEFTMYVLLHCFILEKMQCRLSTSSTCKWAAPFICICCFRSQDFWICHATYNVMTGSGKDKHLLPVTLVDFRVTFQLEDFSGPCAKIYCEICARSFINTSIIKLAWISLYSYMRSSKSWAHVQLPTSQFNSYQKKLGPYKASEPKWKKGFSSLSGE